MARDVNGIWLFPTNSVNPAVIGTAIDPDDFNDFAESIYDAVNSDIYGALSSDYTLTDQNTVQKAFNISSNGAIDVEASTTYMLDALYAISNTGTNAHTWATAFAGTATLTSIGYRANARTGITSAVTITASSDLWITSASATVITASSTSATEFVIAKLNGLIRVNGAGTLIPQVKLSATTGGTLKMLANSYVALRPLGTNALVAMGNWT